MTKALVAVLIGAGLIASFNTTLADPPGKRQPASPESGQRAEQILKEAFAKGDPKIAARVETQDEAQALCSLHRNSPPKDVAQKIAESQLKAIRFPAKFMGDWKQGEKIAQDGYGLRFTDTKEPNRPNGGNCYACHQLAPKELSFGTLGPSLYQFGKLRGNGVEMQKYTYGKIYNAQAYLACSNMPRFGHNQILTEEQIQHVVALLLDPESPVNK